MANKGKWLRLTITLMAASASVFGLGACADDYYGGNPRYGNAYYGARYSTGPYYGPYANRPIGYGPPAYSLYPYNNYPYGYGPGYNGYGYANGVGGNRGYGGGNYYPNGYNYRADRTSKKYRKKLRKQHALRDGENEPVTTQPGYYQR